jgi:hypothetical protein
MPIIPHTTSHIVPKQNSKYQHDPMLTPTDVAVYRPVLKGPRWKPGTNPDHPRPGFPGKQEAGPVWTCLLGKQQKQTVALNSGDAIILV